MDGSRAEDRWEGSRDCLSRELSPVEDEADLATLEAQVEVDWW